MEMNRRAALAGALALPAALSGEAAAACVTTIQPVRRGEALVGIRARNDRVFDPGRRMSIAAYNREFGTTHGDANIVVEDCHFIGCTSGLKFA